MLPDLIAECERIAAEAGSRAKVKMIEIQMLKTDIKYLELMGDDPIYQIAIQAVRVRLQELT